MHSFTSIAATDKCYPTVHFTLFYELHKVGLSTDLENLKLCMFGQVMDKQREGSSRDSF